MSRAIEPLPGTPAQAAEPAGSSAVQREGRPAMTLAPPVFSAVMCRWLIASGAVTPPPGAKIGPPGASALAGEIVRAIARRLRRRLAVACGRARKW